MTPGGEKCAATGIPAAASATIIAATARPERCSEPAGGSSAGGV